MRQIIAGLLTMTLMVAATIGPLGTPAVAKVATKPIKLEGMGYLKARKIILGYGWKPVAGDCQLNNAETCKRYPEVESCACCGTAPCGMLFTKEGRCLGIGTIGGPPQATEEDTVVKDVLFMRHCPK